MSTCVRGGQVYKRHSYKEDVCIRCEYKKGGAPNGNSQENHDHQENHCEEVHKEVERASGALEEEVVVG